MVREEQIGFSLWSLTQTQQEVDTPLLSHLLCTFPGVNDSLQFDMGRHDKREQIDTGPPIAVVILAPAVGWIGGVGGIHQSIALSRSHTGHSQDTK